MPGKGRQVWLVEGSRPRLSTEIAALLRRRLRWAATLLLAMLVAFFTRRLALEGSLLVGSTFYQMYQGLVLIVLAGSVGLLWSRWRLSLGELRALEMATFGVPCLWFAQSHFNLYASFSAPSHADQVRLAAQMCTTTWFAVVLVYGAFIPNTWRRAALVLGSISVTPLAVTTLAGEEFPAVGQVVFWDALWVMGVTMALAFLTALYGSYKLGALRREAFEARELGQYRLTRRLGSGGMGEVYLAEHLLLKRPCAVKLIRPAAANDATALTRFEREVRSAARLTHFNSVEIYDYGRAADGTFFYVMEYLPGMTLQEWVERQGPMPGERVVHLLRQVGEALEEAHGAGLVHRDIKPANVLVTERGGVYDVAKLLDFGLAMPLPVGAAAETGGAAEGLAGSPLYMAPERFYGRDEPDARCDIYSLGAVAYFLLTGQPPYAGHRPLDVMVAQAKESPRPAAHVNPAVPSDLDAIVSRCLNKDPTERFPSMSSLVRALEGCSLAGQWTRLQAAASWLGARGVVVPGRDSVARRSVVGASEQSQAVGDHQ